MPTKPNAVSRRTALKMGAGALVGAGLSRRLSAADRSSPVPPRRPNIVMIVGDDHRHSALGARGEAMVKSPVLDRLAAGGATFTHAHDMGGCQPAVCAPTRACLMTGVNVFRALQDRHEITIAPGLVTLPELLRESGYFTYITGKWHNDRPNLARGFADGKSIFFNFAGKPMNQSKLPVYPFDASGRYPDSTRYIAPAFSTDYFCDNASAFIDGYAGEQPFFLYTAFTAPHDPRTPPQQYAELYDPREVPLPPNFAPDFPFDNGELHVRDEELAPHPRTPDRIRREIAAYYGMISQIDAGVGRIIDALKQKGVYDNTIIIYTADHGIAIGQHGLLGKQNLYDHSTRVPLIIRGPGIPEHLVSDAYCYSWDLYRTLCDLARLRAPEGLDSRSLLPLITGERRQHRSVLHALYKDYQRMVKTDEWKLIEYHVKGVRHTELFSVAKDPWEMRNLAADRANGALLRTLRGKLSEWQRETGDTFTLPA